ncbi:MAG: hypothetical protein J0H40_22820 [Rhizobiales bacterium]|nr:hypothetical protein [Hyphomicrobiales bacterium]
MTDALNQDVQALKEWLRKAWRYLADPTSTTFERRELRNYMKEADGALRIALQKMAMAESPQAVSAYPKIRQQDFRIFRISNDADASV